MNGGRRAAGFGATHMTTPDPASHGQRSTVQGPLSRAPDLDGGLSRPIGQERALLSTATVD